jgi:hypothetical protein
VQSSLLATTSRHRDRCAACSVGHLCLIASFRAPQFPGSSCTMVQLQVTADAYLPLVCLSVSSTPPHDHLVHGTDCLMAAACAICSGHRSLLALAESGRQVKDPAATVQSALLVSPPSWRAQPLSRTARMWCPAAMLLPYLASSCSPHRSAPRSTTGEMPDTAGHRHNCTQLAAHNAV